MKNDGIMSGLIRFCATLAIPCVVVLVALYVGVESNMNPFLGAFMIMVCAGVSFLVSFYFLLLPMMRDTFKD